MSNSNKHEQLDNLYSIAADWHNRMDDPKTGPLERAQLDDWMREDPQHAAAYEAIERMWANTAKIAADPRLMKFRHEALAAVPPLHVRGSRRSFFFTATVIVITIGATILALPLLRNYRPADAPTIAGQKLDAGIFTTAVGERSTVALSDGSSVVLDTQSRIDVAYSPDQRRVRLVSGQAWFQVAHNAARPFIVEAADRRITALGTAFDVRLGSREKSVQVTLVEGNVSVEAIQSPLVRLIRSAAPVSVLTPGDSLVVSGTGPDVVRRPDIAKIASWRQGQLIFQSDTLERAVQEVNRYSNTQIVLADPALATLRVSGVFKAGHSQSFIETVTGHYPINAAEQPDGHVVFTPR